MYPFMSDTSSLWARYVPAPSPTIAVLSKDWPVLQNKDDLVYHLTAHLRMNAVYWGLTALCVMKHREALDREEMINYVMSCWDDKAGQVRSLVRYSAESALNDKP